MLRAASGRALARLGDERPEVTSVEGMTFCLVPAGPFDMGSDDSDDMAYDNEKPLREDAPVDYAYWIGRYPVTNAQFELFVKDDGYSKRDYWLEAEAVGLWRPT